MKIIEPKVKILIPEFNGHIAHVAKCARICTNRNGGDDFKTYNNLIKLEHLSMLRHESHYYIIPYNSEIGKEIINKHTENPYIAFRVFHNYVFMSTNGQFLYEHPYFEHCIKQYEVDYTQFCNEETGFNLMRYSFLVTTQISTSRELNRTSPNNIVERSTRYVYEDGTICRPHWISKEEAELFNNDNNANLDEAINIYLNGCKRDFEEYKILVDKYKIHRQDARGKLPLDTATKCVYTYNMYEWRHIIDLRYYGTTGAPHPNAKLIAGMIREELMEQGYSFRD